MTESLTKIISLCLLGLLFANSGLAQIDFDNYYGAVDERALMETRWRYTYALHLESNTIIHKADEAYDFFLYFRYDYTYQEYLNGKLKKGTWNLNERTLFYTFKHIPQFEIKEINKKTLVLEFNQPKSTGTYQYHFVRVNSEEAPFVRPANELPEVLVEETIKNTPTERKWWTFKSKRKRRKKRLEYQEEIADRKYINVELVGGGYYGGVDPVLKNFTQIRNDGRLIKEFQSVHQGLQVTKKDIPRDELEAFAEFVTSKGFFQYERMYDCEDRLCHKRKQTKPTPIPLRVAVTYGDLKKVVTISIYGKDDKASRYVNYPPELDAIIDAIQNMADRLEPGVARR